MASLYVTTSGNDSTGTGSVGNPYASPGKAMGLAGVDDVVYLAPGTYTLTSSTANVAGGRVDVATGRRLEGYAVTPGDLGAGAIINAGSLTGISVVTLSPAGSNRSRGPVCLAVEADGNSGTGNTGFLLNGQYVFYVYKCSARNCPSNGFSVTDGQGGRAAACFAASCGTGFSGPGQWYGCVARLNTNDGFTGGKTCVRCISHNNGRYGFSENDAWPFTWCDSVSHGNTSDGFYMNTYEMGLMVNLVSTSNGGYGFRAYSNPSTPLAVNCCGYGNSSGLWTTGSPYYQAATVSLTADPWVNASGYDFRPNLAAGGGAALRAAGLGPYGQASYPDIGAVQHQDPGSSNIFWGGGL